MEWRRIWTLSCWASSAALRSGRTLKPMMMALEAVARRTSLSVMEPTPRVDDLDAHLLGGHEDQRVGQHFDRAGDVALDDEGQILDAGGANLLGQAFKGDAGALGELGVALLHLAVLGDALGLVAIGDDQEGVAGVGHGFEAENFDGGGWAGFFEGAAAVVEHGADLAEGVADDVAVVEVEGSVLDEDGGDGAAAAVELGFNDGADGLAAGRRLGSAMSETRQIISRSRSRLMRFLAETSTKTVPSPAGLPTLRE